jgi:hypothetical protein
MQKIIITPCVVVLKKDSRKRSIVEVDILHIVVGVGDTNTRLSALVILVIL